MMQNRIMPTLATLNAAAANGNTNRLENQFQRGVTLTVDITAIAGTTPTITVFIEGYDESSGKYYPILTSAALSAVGTNVLTVYPAIAAVANVSASAVLPEAWRVRWAIAGTTPTVTATIGAALNY